MKGSILIVDDEPIILKNLKFQLEDLADYIFTAETGVEAIDILATQPVHCVLCDINMPKMNGIEVIKVVRARNNNVPFVFFQATQARS